MEAASCWFGEVEGGLEPGAEGLLHLVELGFGAGGDALEEVFGAFDEDALLGFGGLFEEASRTSAGENSSWSPERKSLGWVQVARKP